MSDTFGCLPGDSPSEAARQQDLVAGARRTSAAVMFATSLFVWVLSGFPAAQVALVLFFALSFLMFNYLQWENVRRFYGIAALILAVVFTLVASAHKTFAEFMAIVPFYLAAASALIFLLPGVVAPCPRPHLNSHYDGRWSATSEAEGLLPRTTLGLQDVDALVAAAARPISLRLDGLSGTGYPFMAQGHNVDHWVEAQARRQEILDAAIRAAVRETAVSPTSSSNSDVHSEGRTDRGNAQTSTHARTTPAPSESLSLGSVEPALPSQISSAAWPFFTGSAPPYWIPRITQGRLDLRSLGFWFDRRQNTDSSSIAGTSTRSPVPDAGHMC